MSGASIISISSVFNPDRLWRGASLLVILGTHLYLISLLALRVPDARVERRATMSVFTIPIASARRGSADAQPKREPNSLATVSNTIASRHTGREDFEPSPLSGGIANPVTSINVVSCSLDQDVGQAIERDSAAMREIDATPSNVWTTADAIFLWNGQWLDTGATLVGASNHSLRHAVERAIDDASFDCRNAVSTGPHFLPVPIRSRTMMIVIGSGIWRWADLVALSVECLPAAVIACSQTVGSSEAGRTGRP